MRPNSHRADMLELVRGLREQLKRSPGLSAGPFSDPGLAVIEAALSETRRTYEDGLEAAESALKKVISDGRWDGGYEEAFNDAVQLGISVIRALKKADPQAPYNPAPEYARPEQSDSANSGPTAGPAKGVQVAQPAASAPCVARPTYAWVLVCEDGTREEAAGVWFADRGMDPNTHPHGIQWRDQIAPHIDGKKYHWRSLCERNGA